jgi:anion-transporting  ArsA/GET3 family ATPase
MEDNDLELHIEEIAKYLAGELRVSKADALEIMYEEWDLILSCVEEQMALQNVADEIKTLYMVA